MKELEDIRIAEKYTLTNIEYYEKGYLAGYIKAMLVSDGDFRTYEEYEVLYRIHDANNGNDYTLVSVDYGWEIGNDDVIYEVEQKLTDASKNLDIDFLILERTQEEYKRNNED